MLRKDKKFQLAAEQLTHLLAMLRAAHWIHWSDHWQVQGNAYYGDHLMLERIYTGMVDEIDTLAEKIVAVFGLEYVDPVSQASLMLALVNQICKMEGCSDQIVRSLTTERLVMDSLNRVFATLEANQALTIGMNDFLSATANAHETNVYLLQQRLSRK